MFRPFALLLSPLTLNLLYAHHIMSCKQPKVLQQSKKVFVSIKTHNISTGNQHQLHFTKKTKSNSKPMETVAATITGGGRSFPGWTNIAFISRSFYFYFTQQEEQHPLSLYHAIYAFLLPNLTSFLKLKYQGLDSTPFETNLKTMFICIASFLLYLLAYSIHSHTTPAYANVVVRGAVVLGSLSLVSLASVISPEPIRPVLFLLFSAGLMVNFRLVQVLWNYIQGRMRGNLVPDLNTQQRRIGGPLIDPCLSVVHGYVRREGVLPV